MNIALFGGAFDPPHIGHKIVADSLIENKIVDEVWFVPVFQHPWADRYGKRQLAEYELRVEMLELTIQSLHAQGAQQKNKLVVLNTAKKQKVAHYKDVSFTFNTLEYFSKLHPEHIFSWVMGSEYLDRFDDFLKGHPQLIDYPFFVYPRAGHPFNEALKKKNMTFLHDMTEVSASSTETKELVKTHKDFSALVVPEVHSFILKKNLYQD